MCQKDGDKEDNRLDIRFIIQSKKFDVVKNFYPI